MMALTANSNIEINGSGVDTNGGAFDQSNAGSFGNDMTYGGTAAVVSGVFSCTGTSSITSSAAIFTSSMLGNTVNPVGVAGGPWIITTVTSSTAVVVDTTYGTPPTFTSVAGFIGGPWLTLDRWASIFATSGNLLQTTYLKYGTYTPASALTFSNGNNSINLVGYYQSRGDITAAANKTYRPVIQGGTVIVGATLLKGTNNNFGTLYNLIFDGNSSNIQLCYGFDITYNCRFQNSTNLTPFNCMAEECEFFSLVGGNVLNSFNSLYIGCGTITLNHGDLRNAIVLNSIGYALESTGNTGELQNCTFFGAVTGMGGMDTWAGYFKNSLIFNCGAALNVGNGYGGNPLEIMVLNCASDAAILSGTQRNLVALTANPFINSAATITDLASARAAFALNNTAGGGALCKAAGTPQYLDIGAVQSAPSGGGGMPPLWRPGFRK